jgi:hypothetical protein
MTYLSAGISGAAVEASEATQVKVNEFSHNHLARWQLIVGPYPDLYDLGSEKVCGGLESATNMEPQPGAE